MSDICQNVLSERILTMPYVKCGKELIANYAIHVYVQVEVYTSMAGDR